MTDNAEILTPGVFDDGFAALFQLAKADLVVATDHSERCVVIQTGAAYADASVHASDGDGWDFAWPAGISAAEPLIETMVVDMASGACTPMGSNSALNEAWAPAADQLASLMIRLIAEHEIAVADTAYLTASLTPAPLVTNTPHFDDDQFIGGDGVGLVAIAGQLGGPIVARGTLDQPALATPGQVRLDDETQQQFTDGQRPVEQGEPERIVVFPQFGQLHSGPTLPNHGPDSIRGLLVFRIATIPASNGSQVKPTQPQRRSRSARRR